MLASVYKSKRIIENKAENKTYQSRLFFYQGKNTEQVYFSCFNDYQQIIQPFLCQKCAMCYVQ
jgi:hypothetical protein